MTIAAARSNLSARLFMAFLIAVGAALVLGTPPAAASDPSAWAPGAPLYSNGGQTTVTILNSDAGMVNKLFLKFYVSIDNRPLLIGTNRQPGLKKQIGSYATGKEMVFYIEAYKTGFDKKGREYLLDPNNPYAVFYTGPGTVGSANPNPDGVAHAAVEFLGNGLANVGFEDTLANEGNDWDFNDLVIAVEGVVPGGFVTGGGWLDSPRGAYVPKPSLKGRTNFGFVARYQDGAPSPGGSVEFNFHSGGPNFHSTRLDWLVVSRPKFWIKGSGTIDNQGEYGFLLAATDSGIPSSLGDEYLRMIVWQKVAPSDSNPNGIGPIVYDNVASPLDLNAPLIFVDPSQTTRAGNNVIHKY